MNRFFSITRPARASLAAAVTGVLVGAAMVSTRNVSEDVSPSTLALLRYLIGLVVLAVPLCMQKRVRYPLGDALAIAVLGIFQFAVLMLLLNYALTMLPATTCSLIFSTMPLFTLCLAFIFRMEKYSTRKLTGMALAVAGIAWLVSVPTASQSSVTGSSPLGYAALLGATLTGSVTTLLYRPYLLRYPALPTCSLAMGASALFLVMVCLLTSQPLIPHLSSGKWMNVIFIGLSSGVGFYCWLWALSATEASRVVAFQVLGPVTAAAAELTIAHQLPSPGLLMSMLMVGTGLWLAMRQTGYRQNIAPHEQRPDEKVAETD